MGLTKHLHGSLKIVFVVDILLQEERERQGAKRTVFVLKEKDTHVVRMECEVDRESIVEALTGDTIDSIRILTAVIVVKNLSEEKQQTKKTDMDR